MDSRRIVGALLGIGVLVGLLAMPSADAEAPESSDSPTRVIILVLDQASPDTIERYKMRNVQELMRNGVNFRNGMVGHMAAETVISHGVVTSGQLPKNLGWSNEVYRDVDGILGTAGAYYITSSMSCSQFKALIEAGGYKKLPDYLDDEFGETSKFVSLAQKRTAVCTAGNTSSAAGDGTGTDPEDIILQSRGSSATSCDGQSGWRSPEDANNSAPAYFGLSEPCNRWWTWQAANAYGTGTISPGRIYNLDGNRFVPGFDPAHLGGDIWSTDAAITVIENDPDWRGMMVSLGGIDKLGHMWGPDDSVRGNPGSEQQMRHLPFIAQTADQQVGRLMDALREQGLLDETLVVVTADHAAQTGKHFNGRLDTFTVGTNINACDPATPTSPSALRSDCNWYYGQDADEAYLDPSPAIRQLRDALTPPGGETNLRFSYQDAHIAAWLNDTSTARKQEAAEAILDLPDVIASYRLSDNGDDYLLHGTNLPSTGPERSWFQQHGETLVDTMAAPYGPDVVA
ncbi:MAG TPA: alkaline phosphatase family protein, partial [Nocardioidaceae bacterium]|nr:alkaline phosphatase family protein [Nocardioidaceae bacterium]